MKQSGSMRLKRLLMAGLFPLFLAAAAPAATLSNAEALAVINDQLGYPKKVSYGFGWKAGDAEKARSAVASFRQSGFIPLQDDEQMGSHKVFPTEKGSDFVDSVEFRGEGGHAQPFKVSVFVYLARVTRIDRIRGDGKGGTARVSYFVEYEPFEPMYSAYCDSFCRRYLRNLGVFSHGETATLRKDEQGWQVVR